MDDKLNLKSLDIKHDKIEQLKKAFPEVVTEGKVDFERLKNSLGGEIETGKERYEMKWPGKANLQKIIQEPSIGTLKPVKKDSIEFDTTENLFIEGDSLEVLKLLQKSYYGKVKMIYIDPPYNTGNDFVYPDNYSESLDTYLRYTGQKGEEGVKLTTNAETEGRYHSKWMNMMYPRLFLARNLLKEDGVIFISIDDHEVDNLKKICNEIYGEESFIACIANVNNPKGRSDDKYIATAHEYLCVYKKADVEFYGWKPDERILARYNKKLPNGTKYREIDLRKTGDNDRREDRPNLFYYFLYNQQSKEFYPTRDEAIPEGFIQIKPLRSDGNEGNWRWELDTSVAKKRWLQPKLMPTRNTWSVFEIDVFDPDEKIKPTSAWMTKDVNSERGTEQFINLGFSKEIFPRPKPLGLLCRTIEAGMQNDNNDIVLDFFAGSATTAHAVLDLNEEDEGNRKFIMVQLQEPTLEDSEAFKAGYKNIAEIGEERIRRVIKKIKDENSGKLEFDNKKIDLGFKVFRLEESNFKIWDNKSEAPLQQQLQLSVSNINDDSSDEEILYEIILKSGFELSVPVEKLDIQGKSVYSIDNKSLLICLESNLSSEFIKEIANLGGARVVFLDRGFEGNDQLKTNTVELMKVKGVEFKTV